MANKILDKKDVNYFLYVVILLSIIISAIFIVIQDDNHITGDAVATVSCNYQTSWLNPQGNYAFIKPERFAKNNQGNFYVLDNSPSEARLVKLDSSGHYIKTIGTKGYGEKQYNSLNGIVIDTRNNIYVVDALNHKIIKFDVNGNFVKEIKNKDQGRLFSAIGSIAIDNSDNVYVIESSDTNPLMISKVLAMSAFRFDFSFSYFY